MTHPDAPPEVRPSDAPPPMPGLDALLRASLQDCPDAVLVRDDARALSGRAFDALVQAGAAQLRQCGLRPGERVLLAMGFEVGSLAALFAALRAGLEPALVPCGLRAVDLAVRAKAAGATALVGPTRCGSLELGETYLSAAAVSDAIRLVATLGPGEVDGAVDFSPAALEAVPPVPAGSFGAEAASIVTFEGEAATPVTHRQSALFAFALALVDQAEITPAKPLLSTILPATLAGLVAGPFAALIGAASLAMHGPFAAAAFLRALEEEPGTHLVAPALLEPLLEQAGMTHGGSLIVLSRTPQETPARGRRLVVDLQATEGTRVVSRRRGDEAAAPPAAPADSIPSPLGAALNRARGAAAGG